MPVSAMNHFTILAGDLTATIDFYADLLGLVPGPRPPFDFPGVWLYACGQPILHVIGGRSTTELRAGVIDHMAFTAHGLRETIAKLEQRTIAHDLRRLPGQGTWQLFFHDPNGARVELDFAADEAQ